MIHLYTCKTCKREKKCNILGCTGECIKLCAKCKLKVRLEEWKARGKDRLE